MDSARRESLRTTFEEVPELYDRVRPTYPPALFDELVALAGLPERRPDPRDRHRARQGDRPSGGAGLRDRRDRARRAARRARPAEPRRLPERRDRQCRLRDLGAAARGVRRGGLVHRVPLDRPRGALREDGRAPPRGRVARRRPDEPRAPRGRRSVLDRGRGRLPRGVPRRGGRPAARAGGGRRDERGDRGERPLRAPRGAPPPLGRDLFGRGLHRRPRDLLRPPRDRARAAGAALRADPAIASTRGPEAR